MGNHHRSNDDVEKEIDDERGDWAVIAETNEVIRRDENREYSLIETQVSNQEVVQRLLGLAVIPTARLPARVGQ